MKTKGNQSNNNKKKNVYNCFSVWTLIFSIMKALVINYEY